MNEQDKSLLISDKEITGETLNNVFAQYERASLILLDNTPAFQPPEAHVGHIDLFHVLRGGSNFRYGGILDGHQFRTKIDGSLDKMELVGVGIIGGEETQLVPGDWLWLPPLTPHQHCETDPDTQLLVVKIPVIAKEHVGPSRVPTQWGTKDVVTEGWMKQFEYFHHLVEIVRDVPGDFVECGVGEGRTFGMLAHLIGSNRWADKRILWGFDSFEGWPEPTAYDDSPRKPKKGEWKVDEAMVEGVLRDSNTRKDYPELDIRLIKGFVGDTLPHFPENRQIAFLHLDLDLYPGYRDALQDLFPLVSPGGIIALDEYKEFPETPEYGNGAIEKWPGCTKAVDDYLDINGRPEKPACDPQAKKYFIVKSA